MPPLTRWMLKTGLVYLVVGLMAGTLYFTNAQWSLWRPLLYLNPVYIHLLVVGWITQLIFGVIYWMFPIISRSNMRGNPHIAWAAYILLNVGLIMRAIAEPWRIASPNTVNGWGLVVSSLLQVIAAVGFVYISWGRVRERAGT